MATTAERGFEDLKKAKTLGSIRLRHAESNQIILIPSPTADPNDPLNWSKAYRYYIAILVCAAIFLSNFLAAGPTVAIVAVATTFFGGPQANQNFTADISKTAYFFTTTSLMQGMATLGWMPFIVKYGRRPAYVLSFVLYLVCACWAGAANSYGSELAARIIMGVASGAAEVLAPLTISDVFFLHERGTVMAIYTSALSAGVAGGIIISGLITINHGWRVIYWVAAALIGACVVLVIFAFPETVYRRAESIEVAISEVKAEKLTQSTSHTESLPKGTTVEANEAAFPAVQNLPSRRTYVQNLRIFSGTYTNEPFYKLLFRPFALLTLPPILWATLVMASTIGFLVAISSNFATAFQATYNFEPWQAGLCFIAAIIGSLLAIAMGGNFSDWVANWLTHRNGGLREPEMRLPAIAVSVITAPLALTLYGVGINNHLHWMCPTIGLALMNFSIVQATNVSLVYTIDSYRPVAGEVVVTQMAFKSAFGFLLSFYTNPWVAQSGYSRAFGAMAGISGGIISLGAAFYFFGKKIRHKTWNFRYVKALADWNDDREVGE